MLKESQLFSTIYAPKKANFYPLVTPLLKDEDLDKLSTLPLAVQAITTLTSKNKENIRFFLFDLLSCWYKV